MSGRALAALAEVFGYGEFRPHQEEIIDAAMSGEDVLAVMPTGGGKSLCYQVPALAMEPAPLVLVVSPLIALMREQVAFLRGLGVEAGFLNSTLDGEEWRSTAEAAIAGRLRLLYLAPETLASPRAASLLERAEVDLLAVDEAHCISEWGHDFRPEYRLLGDIRARLRPRGAARGPAAGEPADAVSPPANPAPDARGAAGLPAAKSPRPRVPCLALTATATERVRADIASQLGLERPRIVVAGFDRPNIFLEVRRRARAADQIAELAASFPEGSGIVYCFSRARAEEMAADLSARGIPALPYHAGLPDEVRAANQDAFIRDEARVVCATTAFGMGIDKPDVRFVAHADLPKSIEQYYQEIGRAGRDGLPARALLLFGYGDAMKIRALLAERSPDEGPGGEWAEDRALAAEASLRGMIRYAESFECRRSLLLGHFGERYSAPAAEGCGACDVCSPPGGSGRREELDATEQAYKLLSCVARTGERFGAGHVVDVLLGSRNERVLGLGHSRLSTWGIGKEWKKAQWLELAVQLARQGYLDKDEEYGVLRLTDKARAAFRDRPAISAAISAPAPGPSKPRPAAAGARRPEASPGDAILEEELRSLRKSLAAEAKVPNYMIFSDRTLYDLIGKAPSDEASLLGVFGMGAVKVARHGKAILEAIGRAAGGKEGI